jgi:hypothetical protein
MELCFHFLTSFTPWCLGKHRIHLHCMVLSTETLLPLPQPVANIGHGMSLVKCLNYSLSYILDSQIITIHHVFISLTSRCHSTETYSVFIQTFWSAAMFWSSIYLGCLKYRIKTCTILLAFGNMVQNWCTFQ